jgi:hypothetical protein
MSAVFHDPWDRVSPDEPTLALHQPVDLTHAIGTKVFSVKDSYFAAKDLVTYCPVGRLTGLRCPILETSHKLAFCSG